MMAVDSDLNAGLGELELHSERLTDDDIRVMSAGEGSLQLLHLPTGEISPCSPSSAR